MSFTDRDGLIWMNGELIDWRDATVHALSFSLHYGLAVFEGVRAYKTDKGPAIFRLHDHTKRLLASAHIMQMPVEYTLDELMAAQIEVVRVNELPSAYLRPLMYYGARGGLGLHTVSKQQLHTMVAAWEWGEYLGQDSLKNGIRLKTSSFTRTHPNSSMTKAKVSANYVNSVLALQEATQCGYDEALLLDQNGFVAEGSGENIFMLDNDTLITPRRATILEGFTRETVMMIAEEIGLAVEERLIPRDEVYTADEVFVTGTAAEVTPVCELDNRRIGSGKPGPITQQIQQAYFDIVYGRNDAYQDWLTYVS